MAEREPVNEEAGVLPDVDEHPDPDTPPTEHAPGEPGVTTQQHGGGQFQEAYESVPDDVAATGSIDRDRTEAED